jgi:hypothetical protein
VTELFEDAHRIGHIPEVSLRILESLLPNLPKALELLERKQLTCFEACAGGRQVYCSKGNERHSYLCSRHSCSCRSFIHDVILRSNYVLCKHQIAVCLGEALEVLPRKTLSDSELGLLIYSKQFNYSATSEFEVRYERIFN